MNAEIFKHGINWFIEFYKDGEHMDHCGDWFSGFNENPLNEAIKCAKKWGCKSICIIYK